MVEKETESLRKRNARKLVKKRTKFINIVQKDVGLNVTQIPSKWLIVWGFGLANGTEKKEIETQFQNPEEIRYFYNKSYCFIRYKSVQEATKVKELFEEEFFELSLKEDNPVKRFIGFINEEPPEENIQLVESFFIEIPPGLRLIEDFVNEEEEQLILRNIGSTKQDLNPEIPEATTSKTLKHRWVRHFGYEFRYGLNDIDFDNPLSEAVPNYLNPVISKMKDQLIFEETPEQLTVNQYQCGQGIPPHVDTHNCFESPIVSLSLGSETVMNFRRGEVFHSLVLPPRSLLVMDEESRYGWTHGIANRTFDIVPKSDGIGIDVLKRRVRTSLTFRKLKYSQKCNCLYPEMCNSQKGKISEENASTLEERLVHTVYEKIASHFHDTRHTPWPRVKKFIESVEEGGLILDVGCGNGKYFHLNKNILQIGSDMSGGLLDICREKDAQVLRANALQLPFKDQCCQALICIAVLHHISTKERRLMALKEILRVLSDGGQALIYVWSKDQHHQNEESVYASKQSMTAGNNTVDPCDRLTTDFSFLPVHDRQADFVQNDILVPWINYDKPVHHRYYHVFNEGELENLVKELETIAKVDESYYDQGNWVVRIRRLNR